MSGQADPGKLDAVSPEDAILGQVRDLYVRSGIDGILGCLPELRSVDGCLALIRFGQELRYEDPETRAACVACAEILASQLQPGDLGERALEDFRSDMSLELVWAWLDLKRMDAAEAALGRAAERLLKGTRGPVEKARLLDTWAVFHARLGDGDKARQAARAALACYEEAGELHSQGRALYRLSLIEERHGDAGKMEESLRLVNEALARLDPAEEPGIYFSAIYHRVGCLLDLGRYREARIRLFESLGHSRRHGDATDEILRAVLEGRSNAGLGNLHAAERELITALIGVRVTGDPCMFGLLGLELCAVYSDQGLDAAARAGALKLIPVFETEPLPTGSRKALLYLEMALEDGSADADLLRRVAHYLREIQNDPDTPFRPHA